MKAVAYTRVSSQEQAQGYSLKAQEIEIQKFSDNESIEIIKVFVEKGESAKTADRPQLQKMLDYIDKNHDKVDYLVIWKLDRLARNLIDQLSIAQQLAKYGIRIISVTENNDETPVGNLMRNIMGAFAQFENEDRAKKTLLGMKQAVQEGRWIFHAPLGYSFMIDDQKKKLIVPDENAVIVKDLFNNAASGLYNSATLVDMYKNKIKNFNLKYLKRIISNQVYIGMIEVKWFSDSVKGIHQPIIDEDVFWNAQLLYKPKAKITKCIEDFPLNGFVSYEGMPVSGYWAHGRKLKYRHYRTHKIKFNVNADLLETKFCNLLKEISVSQPVIELFELAITDIWEKENENRADQAKILEKEYNSLIAKRKRLDDLLLDDVIDKDSYKLKKSELDNQIISVRVELNNTNTDYLEKSNCIDYIRYYLSNLDELWRKLSNRDKQALQWLIFPSGVEYQKEKCRTADISLLFNTLNTIENTIKSNGVADGGRTHNARNHNPVLCH